MSSKIKNPFKSSSSGGSSTKTSNRVTSQTVLNNDTEVNVVFDFEELAEVYQERLNFDIETALASQDGKFTDEQKIQIAKIAQEEKQINLQEKSLQEQIKNNRIVLLISVIGLLFTMWKFRKGKKWYYH